MNIEWTRVEEPPRRDGTEPTSTRIMRRSIPDESGCWIWQGAKLKGYGLVKLHSPRRQEYAHRASYEAFVGPIPSGLQIDHLCRTPACVNPAHLEPVTCRENLIRGTGPIAQNVRKTACPKGHAYAEHAYVYPKNGHRQCRLCAKERNATPRARAQRAEYKRRAKNV